MNPTRKSEHASITTSVENQPNPGRRSFLKATAGAAAATAAFAPRFDIPADRAKGANERIGVGFIGPGGRAGAAVT